MAGVHSSSDPGQSILAEQLDGISTLLRRSSYIGLLPLPRTAGAITLSHLCEQVVTISENMERAGLPAKPSYRRLVASPAWRRCLQSSRTGGDDGDRPEWPAELSAPLHEAITEMNDQIEMSPQPSGEWGPAIDTLGEDLLAHLVGASQSSIRRYANRTRPTPQVVAERLHFIALRLADLAGSYNAFGIRRWFTRPRSALGGQSPAHFLGGEFDIDGERAGAVAGLAAALTGAGAA